MKKNLLLMSILFLGVLSSPIGASAEVVNNSNVLPTEYINADRTKDAVTNVDKVITDYMKQKLSMYKVSVVDEDIYKIPNYTKENRRVVGITNYNDSEILVHNNYSSEDEKRILLHELGHTIDTWDTLDGSYYKSVGKYSDTAEFKEIFKEECSSLTKYADEYYFETDVKEFFAESFAIYMNEPDVVKDKAPKLFNFMEKISKLKPVASGWHKSKTDTWFYLENNKFKTGWFKDKDDKWYYFDPVTGQMMANACVDGYTLAPNGVMVS